MPSKNENDSPASSTPPPPPATSRRVSVTFATTDTVFHDRTPLSTQVSVSTQPLDDEQSAVTLTSKMLPSPVLMERKVRPVMRIPTELKLKTITHKVKRPAIDIEFHDLVYTVKTEHGTKTLLKGISGTFETGKLTAIMGPSGAGKTSLMNVLIGYVTNGVCGTILTNDHPKKQHLFHKLSTYIMQEDLIQPNLTVYESMMIAAHLKLGNELSNEEKSEAVFEILKSMGLESCADTLSDKLSGGQRKRTSIALELVNNPPVIFLDEPTSGLDTVTTVQCLQLLKNLAKQGRTIVCTLHQPSSSMFYTLDQVYMMANGLCIYQGGPQQLVPFLSMAGLVCKSTHNPADYILEILNKDITKELCREIQNGRVIKATKEEEYEEIRTYTKTCRRETLATLPHVYVQGDEIDKNDLQFPTSFRTQFYILLKRKLLQQTRDNLNIWIQFVHHLLSAFLLGIIFYNVGNDASRPFDNFKFCISILVFFVYTYAMGPVLTFPDEVKLLEREYFNRWYGLKAYYMMTVISTIPRILIFGTLFQVIVYFMTDQPIDAVRITLFCVIGYFLASISEGIGILVGSLFDKATGSIVAPAFVAPICAVAVYGMGFGTTIEPIYEFLMSLSFLRYSLVATCVTLYDNGRPDMYCDESNLICFYKDPKLLLRDLGMLQKSNSFQFIMMFNFFLLFRVLAYFSLRYRLNKELSNHVAVIVRKVLKRKF